MGRWLDAVFVLATFNGVNANLVREHDTPVSMIVDATGVVRRARDTVEIPEHGHSFEKSETQSHCEEKDSEFEDALDALSWELLASADPSAMRAQEPHLALAAAAQGTSFQSAARARLASWMEAVERSQTLSTAKNDSDVLPPVCPSNVPADDPYWAQDDHYVHGNTRHNICRYSHNCTARYTNLERVNSLRKTLSVTHKFLDKLHVQHGLYGGSVIGATRCKDVLPWDKDSDVFVVQEDVHKLSALFDGVESDDIDDYLGSDYRHKVDLGAFGAEFEGFALAVKWKRCLPFVIVDTSTGYFADVFPLRAVGSHAVAPSVTGKGGHGVVECDGKELFDKCAIKICHQWTLENTLPTSKCQIDDFSHACPAKPYPWLVEQFGPEVSHPAGKTRNGSD